VPPELNIVTGAFGYSGSYISRLLLARGAQVRTLTAHPRRANTLGGVVEAVPFNFNRPDALAQSLAGADTIFNTYWIRFPHRDMTFERAVANIKTLIDAARRTGVRRFVHISITNASTDSPLPYFRGKGLVEKALAESGLLHAIVRPAYLFGGADEILTNNLAWLLRKFPIFAIPGDGTYKLQPVYVEDLARIAIDAAAGDQNVAIDAVGPEIYTFNDFVRTIAGTLAARARIVHVSPALALFLASALGRFTRDVVLTRDEIRGLMASLLISSGPPTAPTRFSEWLARNAATVGTRYASELARRAG
jgi:uncharacterized protein YbjT (DUF2867 family)